MIAKKAKTALFASVMASVVIPVSVAVFVHVDNNGGNEHASIVDEATKNYVNTKINEISMKKDATSKDIHELNKLQLIQDWIEATENGNIDEARHLSAQITADFPPDDEYARAIQSSNVTEKNEYIDQRLQ